MAETTNPIGISEGAKIVRETTSEKSNSTAPTNAETGNKISFLGPTSFFASCGATKPKNEMPPPTATQDPANPTASSNNHFL